MQDKPSCAQCGYPLPRSAEQNAWGLKIAIGVIAVVTTIVVIALVSRAGGTPSPSSGDMMRELRGLDERACSCDTAACAKDLYVESNQWVASYAARIDSFPPDVRGEVLDLASDARACLDDAEAGARPHSRLAELHVWAGFQHEMCRCRDSSCADRVREEMLAKEAPSHAADTEVDHRIEERAKKIRGCSDRVGERERDQSRVSK